MVFQRKYITPNLAEKVNALDVVSQIGVHSAARQLNLSVRTLFCWNSKSNELLSLANDRHVDPNSRVRLTGAGRRPIIKADIEQSLIEYVDAQRSEENKVTLPMLVALVRTLDDASVTITRDVLRRRIWRVLHRNNIGIRRTTHQAQKTRLDIVVINDWIDYIKEKMIMFKIDDANMANFDETPVYFSPVCAFTLNRRGERTISARKSDTSQRCTAMIGVSRDGHKFPPFVIFKGSTGRSGRIALELRRVATEQETTSIGECGGFPLSNFYAVQENAWMDTPTMLEWVAKVWKPWTISKNGAPTMLILDEMSAHMTTDVRNAIAVCNSHLVLIPGGYTSKLQVMDVGFNKPFKNHYRDFYDEWFMMAPYGVKPKRTDVSVWIEQTWGKIEHSVSVNTWRKIGLPYPVEEEGESNENDTAGEVEEQDSDEIDNDPCALDESLTSYDTRDDDSDLDDN